MKRIFYILFILLSINASSIFGIKAIQGDGYIIFYPEGYDLAASEVAASYESVKDKVKELIGTALGNITFVVEDAGSYTNGMADPVQKRVFILTWPKPYRFMNFEKWYPIVVSHELTHMAHLPFASGIPKTIQDITGLPLISSQFRSPFVESTTVFTESSLGIGGRLNNPLIRSLACSMARGDWLPDLPRISSPPAEDFLGFSLYYYIPSQFYSFLAEKYGIEKVKEWLKEYSGYFMGFGIEKSAEKVFGKSFTELYREWKSTLLSECNFSAPKHELYSKKMRFISNIASENGQIYLAYRDFGASTLYGWNGHTIATSNNGKVHEILKVRYFSGTLRVKDGKIYFLALKPLPSKVDFFQKMRSEIYEYDLKTGKVTTLISGMISAFDLLGGSLVYAEYDPKSGKSTIHLENKSLKIDGFVREITAWKDKLHLLVSDKYGSSSIYTLENGRFTVFRDGRFKYSLKIYNGELMFVAFDDDGANIYKLSGKKLIKLTRNLAVLDFTKKGDALLAVSFSEKQPATAIFAAKPSPTTAAAALESSFKLKTPSFKEIDPLMPYTLQTLFPHVHIPLAVPPELTGGNWSFGALLGGSSPEGNLYWIAFPNILSNGQVDISGGFNLNIGALNIFASKIFSSYSLSGSFELLRTQPSPDSMITSGFKATLDSGYWAIKGYTDTYFGNTYISAALGFGSAGPLAEASAYIKGGNFIVKGYAGYEAALSVEGGLIFPLLFTDAGNFDPYFHLSHIFLEIDGGYNSQLYGKIMLGFEEADIITYSRNFPKIGIQISETGVSICWGIGF